LEVAPTGGRPQMIDTELRALIRQMRIRFGTRGSPARNRSPACRPMRRSPPSARWFSRGHLLRMRVLEPQAVWLIESPLGLTELQDGEQDERRLTVGGLARLTAVERDHSRLRRRPDLTAGWSVQARIKWMTEPVSILTVGDLKSELSRWSDETPVTFRSPLNEQEFRFYRYRPAENLLVIEINGFPETSPEVLPGA
jgi:hypothetical protein